MTNSFEHQRGFPLCSSMGVRKRGAKRAFASHRKLG